MGSENDEIVRFLTMIDEAIKNKEVEDMPKYKQTRGKVRLLPDESANAAEEVKKMERAKQNKQ